MSFNTDLPETAPCDRNNCRCGDNTNCMYYNSSGPGQAHYNYVAVQGAGDPRSPYYGCMRRSMDQYNAENYYADHAGAVVPGYGARQVVQNDLDFSTHRHHPAPVAFCNHGVPMMRCGMCGGGIGMLAHRPLLGLPLWVWVVLAAVWIWAIKTGRLPKVSLSDRATQIILVVLLVWVFFVRQPRRWW